MLSNANPAVISKRIAVSAAVLLLASAGCEKAVQRMKDAREMNRQAAEETVKSEPTRRSPTRPRKNPKADEEPLPEIAASGLLYDPSAPSDEKRLGGVTEDIAVRRALAYVREAAKLDPTLVVWLLDRSPSASKIVYQSSRSLDQFYTEFAKGRVPEIPPREEAPQLLTAIVSFGEDVQFPLEVPTGDTQAVIAALDGVSVDAGPRERTFAAVEAAIDKYLPQRTEHGRALLLVMVTDEAGDDAERVDTVLAAPRKYGVPIYVIGAPAPFGAVSALPQTAEGDSPSGTPSSSRGVSTAVRPPLVHGPESLALEHIDLPSFVGFRRSEVLDSGFGPFGLERLCRATGGEFITLQPPQKERHQLGGALSDWPSALGVRRFEKEAMRRYAPDYVSAEAYQQLLKENGARRALHEAAKVEGVEGTFYPETSFPRENEAQLQRRLSDAQQMAARLAPPVDRVYELLQAGEADRAKLTEPRWQAGFDLALGRAASAKARIDGYNTMLALLKRGRSFANKESKTWVLTPADATEAGTAIERYIAKARDNLDRVVREHPGTPWAYLAQQELESKFGWQWSER